MGLNDEQEKLKQAAEWLKDCDVNSQKFSAACGHIGWLLRNTEDIAVYTEAKKIADSALERLYAA